MIWFKLHKLNSFAMMRISYESLASVQKSANNLVCTVER